MGKQESYKHINSIELKSAKSKKSINFYKLEQDHRFLDFATAGTEGESSEELEEGFFTPEQQMANDLSSKKPLNIDIHSAGRVSAKMPKESLVN